MPPSSRAFDLPDRLAAKREPSLVAADEARFATIAATLDGTVAQLTDRLAAELRAPAGEGQAALDRDQEVHRLTARLGTLRRFGIDLCLGRIVRDDGETVYIGRLGLTDGGGTRLLVDWRSPAAEPFFGATHADPMGLASRRRYRWTGRRITDYWDEAFTDGALASGAALEDQSAFIASLGASRSATMRDVLGTIAADQDAIIRAGSRGALVVDGGPGTGKTVVALHRAAYLLYADPRLAKHHGGVLFVGPHPRFLAYVDDVLPSLGEDGVRLCTLRDLVPEGATAGPEPDPRVARLKASGALVDAIDAAARHYERPPTTGLVVSTPWADLRLDPEDWAEAFGAPDPGTPHDEARDPVWEALVAILLDRLRDTVGDDLDASESVLRRGIQQDEALRAAFDRAWPLLDPAGVVGDLWSVPAYLRQCAPGLSADEVALLQRADPHAWTVSDLPLLDAARQRIGDPDATRMLARRRAALARQRERMSEVVDDLIAADDSEMGVMSILRRDDGRTSLEDESELPSLDPDVLAGPFAHIVVDEAQELTDAEWRMLLQRCPSRSFTIVGDRAQARHGFAGSWRERLARVGIDRVETASLRINYRTSVEVMAAAEPVIRSVLPDANVPTSVRTTGVPVARGAVGDLEVILDRWLTEHADGIACVIGDPTRPSTERVRSLSPEVVKGLEFDLVVLVEPERFGAGVEGAVDRYVAMTRATQQLVVLSASL